MSLKQNNMDVRGKQIIEEDESKTTWSCLSHEILSIILSKLVAREIANFRAVCKWWKSTPRPMKSQPPLVGYSDTPFLLFTGKLFHPINVFSNPIMEVDELPRAEVCASNCGWLLMTLGEGRIFFFNPFTNKKIKLPSLEDSRLQHRFTFSSPPTSPDCVLFGIMQSAPGCGREVTICTLKPGEVEWDFQTFDRPYFDLLECNPILFEGLYYCLGQGGSLLIYDLKKNKPRWITKYNLRNLYSSCRCYMVESKGKLLLVYNDIETQRVNMFRLDFTKPGRIWEKLDNLGDMMLFVSNAASFSSKSVVKGPENKIYFPRMTGNSDELFYSLDTHRYHCFVGGRSWQDMNGTTSHAHSTWIMPSTSNNNLNICSGGFLDYDGSDDCST